MGRGGHRVHLEGDTRTTSEFTREKEVIRRSAQGSCKPSTNVENSDAWRGFCHQLPECSLDQRTSYAIHQAACVLVLYRQHMMTLVSPTHGVFRHLQLHRFYSPVVPPE